MKAKDILDHAGALVTGDRQRTYGDVAECHSKIARLWNAFDEIKRDPRVPDAPEDVAIKLALMKIARTQMGVVDSDSYTDAAAYLAIAGEIASGGAEL